MQRHPNGQLIWDYLHSVEKYLKEVEAGTNTGPYKNLYFADDISARYQGRNDVAGLHEGKAFLEKYVARLAPYKSELVEIVDVLGGDNHGAAIVKERMTNTKTAQVIEFTRVAVYTIVNGKIKQMWSLDDDQYKMDEFLKTPG